MRYFVLAGEASGDKQAALLCEAIRQRDPEANMQGWGGEAMIAQGVNITKHYRDLAFMGFVEVIRHLPTILRNFKICKSEILSFKPDALILVDYPGFNLRMAKWAFQHKIPVYYYISPQLWAWHTSRVHNIKKAVKRMYVILPFEKSFYKKFDMEAIYIGHPLAQAINNENLPAYSPVENQIALLPGSRKHEIQLILPEMLGVAQRMPKYLFKIVKAAHLPVELYKSVIGEQPNMEIVEGNLHHIVRSCNAAIVTSGTATLETALLGVPQVVVYKGNPFSYSIAKRLIKVNYISLVNLIAEHSLVPELIQKECNPDNIQQHLINILQPELYVAIRHGYEVVKSLLLEGGGVNTAAEDIISHIQAS